MTIAVGQLEAVLAAARPQALGALLRYFRDLDVAEDAYQEACLRAMRHWPHKGLPRDAAAWLIFVGRNFALDQCRRRKREQALPPEDQISDLDDTEASLAEHLDAEHYRDDVLRLMFVCCHPQLPGPQQVALALRIVAGLSVPEIARAFLVTQTAMEQRLTRAKRVVAAAAVPFESPGFSPGAPQRSARLAAVGTMIYLLFNEGYAATAGEVHVRQPLCEEAIRLARLLSSLFPDEPEIMGLLALLLLQHSRAPARLSAAGEIVLLEDQDRSRWDHRLIEEGLALVGRALSRRRTGPYQIQAAIAAVHARAANGAATEWAEIDQLYAVLEFLQPSPVVTLNRAVAVARLHGPEVALDLIEPLGEALSGYFHYFGLKGALLMQLGRLDEARTEFTHAIGLAHTAAQAAHIRSHLDRLSVSVAGQS